MKADHMDVTHKLKIARGQIDGVLRMIEDDRYCIDISNQIMATEALLKKVNQEIMEAHIRNCVKESLNSDEENPKVEEALRTLEKMMK